MIPTSLYYFVTNFVRRWNQTFRILTLSSIQIFTMINHNKVFKETRFYSAPFDKLYRCFDLFKRICLHKKILSSSSVFIFDGILGACFLPCSAAWPKLLCYPVWEQQQHPAPEFWLVSGLVSHLRSCCTGHNACFQLVWQIVCEQAAGDQLWFFNSL